MLLLGFKGPATVDLVWFGDFDSNCAQLWPTGWQSTSCIRPFLLLITQFPSSPPLSVLFWSPHLIPISYSCIHLQVSNFWPASTTFSPAFCNFSHHCIRPFSSFFGRTVFNCTLRKNGWVFCCCQVGAREAPVPPTGYFPSQTDLGA